MKFVTVVNELQYFVIRNNRGTSLYGRVIVVFLVENNSLGSMIVENVIDIFVTLKLCIVILGYNYYIREFAYMLMVYRLNKFLVINY